jgi:hypothetical protein
MARGSKRWARLSATARIVVALAALAPTAPAAADMSAEHLAPVSAARVGFPTAVAPDSEREAGEWERLRRQRSR